MECVLVSHTHWDREWYRTFEEFRARLVDTVDRVLDQLAADPGWAFLLDGQSVIVEDYLEIRPHRRAELERAVTERRLAIGPWYVQPDSLLPSGEAHVRNLLEGRRAGEQVGPVSRVGYTPDSFGHPGQLPQLLAGFGIDSFVYWRGNGDEIAELPPEYRWVAPDGSEVLACHLPQGYFAGGALPDDVGQAVARLEALARLLGRDRVLLMNGADHLLPDTNTARVADALAAGTGWRVQRGLLEDFVEVVDRDGLPRFRGELVGGRLANLLAGVWSTRMPLKLRNRACETALVGWAEPWAALGRAFGLPDERPALRRAWRSLLQNQAHDSICGCSEDAVHRQMASRYDTAVELADQTTARVLERVAGLDAGRRTPWSTSFEVAVFNPSPRRRSDVVRVPLEGYPPFVPRDRDTSIHPLLVANVRPGGFLVDGRPARLVTAEGNRRVRLVPEQHDWELEVVAEDVPAFGYRRCRVERVRDASPDEEDDGREIGTGDIFVRAADDGTLTVSSRGRTFAGLVGLEDVGDRGDSYDADPVLDGTCEVAAVEVRRRRHVSGIQLLEVRRTVDVPARLDPEDRSRRSNERVPLTVITEARLTPGVVRVDLRVTVENNADDHRLRLLFPTGGAADRFLAATTFDVVERETAPRDASAWVHPAPATFPHQGWVAVNGLTVGAPGLPEAEVTPEGVLAVTLVRAVGWLNRLDLTTRPVPAGPSIAVPDAQCRGRIEARLTLAPGADPHAVADAELGLRAVVAGDAPLVPADTSLLSVEPASVLLSAVKPAEHGDAVVVRVLNPTDEPAEAVIGTGLSVRSATAVRLDETPVDEPVAVEDGTVRLTVRPHRLAGVRIEIGGAP